MGGQILGYNNNLYHSFTPYDPQTKTSKVYLPSITSYNLPLTPFHPAFYQTSIRPLTSSKLFQKFKQIYLISLENILRISSSCMDLFKTEAAWINFKHVMDVNSDIMQYVYCLEAKRKYEHLLESLSSPTLCLPAPEPTRQVVPGLVVERLSNVSNVVLVTVENQPSCSGVKSTMDVEKEIYGIKETNEKMQESNRIIQELLESHEKTSLDRETSFNQMVEMLKKFMEKFNKDY